MDKKAKQAKQELLADLPSPVPVADFLSTGITLANLAISGHPNRGIAKGHLYRVCGRSSSGKTFLCRTVLAEAAISTAFDGYELIYDDVERGALMDTAKFFGKRLVDRLVPPRRARDKSPIYSRTVSDFYTSIREKLDEGKRFIWILDSLDSLSPDAESKMTDGKAKANSQELRKLIDPLKESGSILILVSQVRVDMRSMFGGDIASGGMAPEFYSTLEIWLRKVKTLKTSYKGKKYPTGILVSCRIKKNRVSGQDQTVFFPFSSDYGIDDIGSMVDFLITSHHWPKSKGQLTAEELSFQGSRDKLIAYVEEHGLEPKLKTVTAKVWREIRQALTTTRKPRYE